MITLAINTASSSTAIALFEGGGLLKEDSWQSENNEAEKLMPAIDQLCTTVGRPLSEISRVLAIQGPGSFTGLRVGITVANTIAYLNNAKLYAIDHFQYFWESLDSSSGSNLGLLIFAGKGGVYFSHNQETAQKAQLINLPEVAGFLKSQNITDIFGDITDDQKTELKEFPFHETKPSFGQIITKTLAKIDELEAHQIIKPIYIKRPSISKSKKTIFTP